MSLKHAIYMNHMRKVYNDRLKEKGFHLNENWELVSVCNDKSKEKKTPSETPKNK